MKRASMWHGRGGSLSEGGVFFGEWWVFRTWVRVGGGNSGGPGWDVRA